MVRFGAALRGQGLPVTVIQVVDAVRALDHIDLRDRDEMRLALRALLVSRPEDLPGFDQCFDAFWRLQLEPEPGLPSLMAAPPTGEAPAEAALKGESRRESLAH
jgi:uncharacterized protein with von Willebrand factor type A (vWA) domain